MKINEEAILTELNEIIDICYLCLSGGLEEYAKGSSVNQIQEVVLPEMQMLQLATRFKAIGLFKKYRPHSYYYIADSWDSGTILGSKILHLPFH